MFIVPTLKERTVLATEDEREDFRFTVYGLAALFVAVEMKLMLFLFYISRSPGDILNEGSRRVYWLEPRALQKQ